MSRKVSTLADLARRLDRDPEYRKEYWRQRPYYDVLVDLIQHRKRRGLTQAELAELADTYQSQISRIESANYDIRLSTLIRIAEALGTHVDICLVENIEDEEWQRLMAQTYRQEERPERSRNVRFVPGPDVKVRT